MTEKNKVVVNECQQTSSLRKKQDLWLTQLNSQNDLNVLMIRIDEQDYLMHGED